MTIAIQNAQPGHCQQVGLKRAERLVKRGRATWSDSTRSTIVIAAHVLTAQEVDAQSAQRRAIARSERDYDSISRMMTMDEVCNPHFPTVGGGQRMFHGKPIAHELRACGLIGVRT